MVLDKIADFETTRRLLSALLKLKEVRMKFLRSIQVFSIILIVSLLSGCASVQVPSTFNDPWIPANGPDGEKGLTYSFGYNNAFFIGLDEFVNPIKVNQAWLDNELMSNKRAHVFVYGHDPAFRVTHTDSLASYPHARDAFWDSLGNAGVKIYFCGHDHFYNRAHVKDRAGNIIYQVLPGSGGAPFTKWQPRPYAEGPKVVNDYHDEVRYGYVLGTIDDTKVIMEWKALFKEEGRDVWKTMDTLEYLLK
jgi:hypothetical protein